MHAQLKIIPSVCMCLEARAGYWASNSTFFRETRFLTEPAVRLAGGKLKGSSRPTPSSAGAVVVVGATSAFQVDAEDLNSGPHAFPTTTFSHQAFSPAPEAPAG